MEQFAIGVLVSFLFLAEIGFIIFLVFAMWMLWDMNRKE